jgi:hypothetical protein
MLLKVARGRKRASRSRRGLGGVSLGGSLMRGEHHRTLPGPKGGEGDLSMALLHPSGFRRYLFTWAWVPMPLGMGTLAHGNGYRLGMAWYLSLPKVHPLRFWATLQGRLAAPCRVFFAKRKHKCYKCGRSEKQIELRPRTNAIVSSCGLA